MMQFAKHTPHYLQEILMHIHKTVQSFDPFVIAAFFSFPIKYIDASENFKGCVCVVKEEPLILLNSNLLDSPEKFVVLAHEVAHAVAHPSLTALYSLNDRYKNKLETEADKFTATLLFHLFYEQYGYYPSTFFELQHAFCLADRWIHLCYFNNENNHS